MISLEHGEDGAVTRLGAGERELLRGLEPGAIILFAVNFESVPQVRSLIAELQAASAVPLLVATDHEGGLVSRLTAREEMGATVMPSATLVSEADSMLRRRGDTTTGVELAREWGAILGRELRSLGITVNMAPVADVDPEADIGFLESQRRTFGSDHRRAAQLVGGAVRGMRSAGILPVVKHFPGHGQVTEDSHTELASVSRTPAELRAVELAPFRAAITAGAAGVMTAHARYPDATATSLPATFSPELLTDLLRDEMGFTGVIITDALNMEAISGLGTPAELALAALRAGADMLLQPVDPLAVHASLVDAVDSGILSRERVEESVRRIMRVKVEAGLLGPAGTTDALDAEVTLGAEEHRAFAAWVRSIARGEGE
jgi:beta-N-acetylhexosaminidase